jgi:ribonuclease HI
MKDIQQKYEALKQSMLSYIRTNSTPELLQAFGNCVADCTVDQLFGFCRILDECRIGKDSDNKITIYTDGACSGNPGPGGFAYVVKKNGLAINRRSMGFRKTTNNRMELMAVIDALSNDYGDAEIEIISDSQYVTNAVNKGWLRNWAREDFVRPQNEDLWKHLYRILQTKKVTFTWVKGHNGNPDNEWCDREAVKACGNPEYEDSGYNK